MQINLLLSKNLFAPYALPYMFDYSHRWEIWNGSAGSAKSYSITLKLIIRACREQIRILVCRRYATTIRNTVFSLFKEILKKWKLTLYVKINESDYRITFPNGSEIIFTGLDEETKLLSLSNISTVFIEEVYEVSRDAVELLNLRMRGNNANQQIIMAFNPISKSSWLYEFCNNPPENSAYIHSTYKDNPFLSEEYIKALEELLIRNPKKAKVFVLGEWGSDVDGLVFSNWQVASFDVMELAKTLLHRAGADLGFIDPTVVIDSLYDSKNKTIYVVNEFFKSGCLLNEVYEGIKKMRLLKTNIFFDSAEPRSIDYFKRQGVWAKPCLKGPDSVLARILFLQDHRIVINPECKKLIEEFENFSYELDKKTGKYIDGKYTHEWSHGIDALGYAYSDIYTKGKLKTIEKGVLGL